ncbi:cysteine hydrolase family protein [Microvirga guangxiensis]|uniref:Nicotinamidase-related amidase n=1 Tax=Microvirga guangxiensis TaxID=549386 RepID=A0A1G5BCS0_9HYPH|nr:isochorismatase family cysteine hydrolase [Microvirga guangxiensis]SCX87870.1 Nicotinamidase-related amidase [Microvirga guangxiensis]
MIPFGPNTLHLCIDMQRLFSSEGPWPTPWMERVLPTVAQIAEQAPDRTVFTRFIPPYRPEDMPGAWRIYYERWREVTREHLDPRLLELMPPLQRLVPPATMLDKPVYSAFAGHKLRDLVSERGIDTLLVTGSETDMCVLATVLGAVDLGLRVVIVSDGVCSSSDEGHDSLLTLYTKRYSYQVETVSSEAVLAQWPS